ncbi:MAG: hypothetical protein WC817_02240 [Patescibacteria group bacterium]|jgi:hypothetical protein
MKNVHSEHPPKTPRWGTYLVVGVLTGLGAFAFYVTSSQVSYADTHGTTAISKTVTAPTPATPTVKTDGTMQKAEHGTALAKVEKEVGAAEQGTAVHHDAAATGQMDHHGATTPKIAEHLSTDHDAAAPTTGQTGTMHHGDTGTTAGDHHAGT